MNYLTILDSLSYTVSHSKTAGTTIPTIGSIGCTGEMFAACTYTEKITA